MYLSFIEEEKTELARRMDALEELESSLENKCDEIIESLREQMREEIHEAIGEAFGEAGIEDTYMCEKFQEAVDSMQEFVERNF